MEQNADDDIRIQRSIKKPEPNTISNTTTKLDNMVVVENKGGKEHIPTKQL